MRNATQKYRSICVLVIAIIGLFVGLDVQAGDVRLSTNDMVVAYPNIKLAVIVVKFPAMTVMPYMEGTKTPWTSAYLETKLFSGASSMAAYYSEVSRGVLSVTGAVYDRSGAYYTIDMPATIDGSCDWTSYFEDAIRAADPDIDFTQYNTVAVLAPSMSCGTGGLAASIIVPDAGQRYGIFDADGVLDATPTHELGHLLGWGHANAWTCTPPGILTGDNCALEEYGDRFSVMGLSTARMLYPAAPHMENIGWLTAGDIQTVSAEGDYTLRPYETEGSAPRVLKIPRARDVNGAVTSWYYLEYRQAISFDNIPRTLTIQELGVTSGALVHVGSGAGTHITTTLLDMTPGSLPQHDIFDPALPTGASYVDTTAGVAFGVVASSSTSMTIRVAFTTESLCQRKAPSVTATAPKKSARAGQTLRYTVTVKNNDVLCGSQSFAVKSVGRPKGWKVTIGGKSTGSVDLKPGEKKKFDVRVTLARSARVGKYSVGIDARQTDNPTIRKKLTVRPVVVKK